MLSNMSSWPGKLARLCTATGSFWKKICTISSDSLKFFIFVVGKKYSSVLSSHSPHHILSSAVFKRFSDASCRLTFLNSTRRKNTCLNSCDSLSDLPASSKVLISYNWKNFQLFSLKYQQTEKCCLKAGDPKCLPIRRYVDLTSRFHPISMYLYCRWSQ